MADNLTVLRSIAKKIETMPERDLRYLMDLIETQIERRRLIEQQERGDA